MINIPVLFGQKLELVEELGRKLVVFDCSLGQSGSRPEYIYKLN